MSVETTKVTDQSTIQLPSIEEFYLIGMSQYVENLVAKINRHLNHCCETRQSVSYSKQTNEELTRRGLFLTIIYEYIRVVKTLSDQLSGLNQKHSTMLCMSFQNWIKTLIMPMQDLTKINRIKSTFSSFTLDSIQDFNQKLLFLLYQTEVYVFQIMMRIYLHQYLKEQKQQYDSELFKLRRRYYIFDQEQAQSKKQERDGREKTNPLSKQDRRRRKILFKEINQIINFYQCQISINRSDCSVKPEIDCLQDLLKQKLEQHILREILDNTVLGDLFKVPVVSVKASNFSPFIIVPVQLDERTIQTEKYKKLAIQTLQSFCFSLHNLTGNFMNMNKDEIEKEKQPQQLGGSASKTFCADGYSSPRVQKDSASKNVENKESESSHRLKSLHKRSHKHSTPMAHLSSQEKLQFIGFNQRFSQNICNLTKRLVKVKKERQFSDDSKSESRYPRDYFQSTRQVPIYPQSWNDSSENVMILADQTPVDRKQPLWPDQKP